MTQSSDQLDSQFSSDGAIRTADAGVSAVAAGVDPNIEDPLADLKVLDRGTAEILSGVARAMYPHDKIPDLHYQRIAAALDVKAAADENVRTTLTEGVGFLATTTGKRPEEFAGLPESEQVMALTRLQETPFFLAIAAEVVVNLYSQHDVWPYFGYEGPSTDQGGYLHRGFDDIDWLDAAPDRRGAPVSDERTDGDAHIQTASPEARDREGVGR